MFAGGFLHADDIRTLANNSSSMEAQIATVRRFANDNFLTMNASKCEIVVFEKFVGKTHRNTDVDFPMKNEGKCLGYTWSSNLPSLPMIKERIQKARKTFFQFGSIHAFQGNLSPVSTSSIISSVVFYQSYSMV